MWQEQQPLSPLPAPPIRSLPPWVLTPPREPQASPTLSPIPHQGRWADPGCTEDPVYTGSGQGEPSGLGTPPPPHIKEQSPAEPGRVGPCQLPVVLPALMWTWPLHPPSCPGPENQDWSFSPGPTLPTHPAQHRPHPALLRVSVSGSPSPSLSQPSLRIAGPAHPSLCLSFP